MENPFAEGENRIIRPPATVLVIFGASGDLTHRKLVPALANLAQDGYLPEQFFVIGASRTALTDEEFREKLRESVTRFSRRPIASEVWRQFAERIFYLALDGKDPAAFVRLRQKLGSLEERAGERLNYLYYLSTAPEHFAPIATNLKGSGLVESPGAALRTTFLIVEKPFGFDKPSAKELNQLLRKNFREEQIFRIDHYLGKETVQNILVFRFANGIFEPLWNAKYIDHIEISVCEDIGVGSRAPYFDSNGITRDVVQNHLLQMLALLCIEPPISLTDPDSIRNEKVKVLRMIRRMSTADVHRNTARAQYRKGFIQGSPVAGYLDEKGVSPNSQTETAVAMKLQIDNWRWAGVPIYVRAGKRLPKRITQISVLFKAPPAALFKGRQVGELFPNVLSIQVQPKEGISLSVNSKPPGPRLRVRTVEMDFTYDHSFGIASPEAYERLLLDAMKGDQTLFTRDDEIDESWDLLAPIFEAWTGTEPPPLNSYEAGTWGPPEFDQLLESSGHSWRTL
jgi:glucose-6-phosphate 1-dehydrogenase